MVALSLSAGGEPLAVDDIDSSALDLDDGDAGIWPQDEEIDLNVLVIAGQPLTVDDRHPVGKLTAQRIPHDFLGGGFVEIRLFGNHRDHGLRLTQTQSQETGDTASEVPMRYRRSALSESARCSDAVASSRDDHFALSTRSASSRTTSAPVSGSPQPRSEAPLVSFMKIVAIRPIAHAAMTR
ncbi:hypothetical protein SAMN04489752_2858 [Brevibacterium siliguriense]|uniref:Uncharacterized protein n=1 Tax=Brevibacterium siliguriense TaxID=1136497 RepID=A0A1H1W5Z5_9MICO|nr:hypothetical protein SAMN04489752_2858 [Brevibacterium siliguriense]